MNDNDHNLGGFFKKKMNELEQPQDAWGLPDPQLRASILTEITNTPKAINSFQKYFFIGVGVLILSLLGGYIFYLKNQNTELLKEKKYLEIALKEKIETFEINTKDLVNLEKNLNQNLIISEKETSDLNNKNASLLANNEFLNNQISVQKRQISNLTKIQNEYQLVLKNQQDFAKSNTPQNQDLIIKEASKSTLIVNKLPIKKVNKLVENYPTILKLNAPKNQLNFNSTKKRFEVGIEQSFLNFDVPINRTFERQEVASETVQANHIRGGSRGINLAYSPRKNWWIKTGIRHATLAIRRAYSISLAYDKTHEVTQLNGDISNELFLTTSTNLTETRSSFDLVFEPSQALETGDLLEVTIRDFFSINYLQIPFAIQHFQGEDKFQWFFQGGIQWNRAKLNDYSFVPISRARGQAILVNQSGVISRDIAAKQFLSAMAGVGVNFQLLENWHLRAAFNYDYNFINSKSSEFSNSSKYGTAFSVGLNYRI